MSPHIKHQSPSQPELLKYVFRTLMEGLGKARAQIEFRDQQNAGNISFSSCVFFRANRIEQRYRHGPNIYKDNKP